MDSWHDPRDCVHDSKCSVVGRAGIFQQPKMTGELVSRSDFEARFELGSFIMAVLLMAAMGLEGILMKRCWQRPPGPNGP